SGSRAIEVGASRVQSGVGYAFRVFGRSQRASACDCDRSMEPALPQTLYLMADPVILKKLRDSAVLPAKLKADKNNAVTSNPLAGRLAHLLYSGKTDEQVLDELFLATLSRFPTDAEQRHFETYRQTIQNVD